jgi:hypothetical protein
MRGLRTLMLILLAAVFAVGGPLRAMPCHAEAIPPCHDLAGMAHDKTPLRKSKPDALAPSCCAGCLPAAARDLAPAATPGAVVRLAFAPVSPSHDGLSPAPDHEPPRPLA